MTLRTNVLFDTDGFWCDCALSSGWFRKNSSRSSSIDVCYGNWGEHLEKISHRAEKCQGSMDISFCEIQYGSLCFLNFIDRVHCITRSTITPPLKQHGQECSEECCLDVILVHSEIVKSLAQEEAGDVADKTKASYMPGIFEELRPCPLILTSKSFLNCILMINN